MSIAFVLERNPHIHDVFYKNNLFFLLEHGIYKIKDFGDKPKFKNIVTLQKLEVQLFEEANIDIY